MLTGLLHGCVVTHPLNFFPFCLLASNCRSRLYLLCFRSELAIVSHGLFALSGSEFFWAHSWCFWTLWVCKQNLTPYSKRAAGAGSPCSPWGVPEFGLTIVSIVVAFAFIVFSFVTTLLSIDVNPLSQAVGAVCIGRVCALPKIPNDVLLPLSGKSATWMNGDCLGRPESLMILRYRWRHSGTLCASPAWCWVSCRSTCRRPSALQLSSSLRARWPMRTSRPYLSIAAWRTVCAEESTSVSRGLPFPGTSSAQGLGYRLDSPKFLMIGKRRHLAVRFA